MCKTRNFNGQKVTDKNCDCGTGQEVFIDLLLLSTRYNPEPAGGGGVGLSIPGIGVSI